MVGIDVRDGRVRGVILDHGERLRADVVVSDVDPSITYGRLIAQRELPSRLRDKLRRTEPSLATFVIYLGMRRDITRFGLGRFNVWDHPSYDLDALYAPALQGRLPDPWFFFLSPNSLKDETGTLAPPGCSSLEVMTFVPYAHFERWRDTIPGHRPPEYEAEKTRVAEEALAALDQRYPGLVGDVVVREISTPLTNEHYVSAPRGGAYGPALVPSQAGWRRFGTRAPIAGLFLAGAGVLGDGVGPCLASGRLAARAAVRAMGARRWWAPPVLRPSPAS